MAIPPPSNIINIVPAPYSSYPQTPPSPTGDNFSHRTNSVWYYTYVISYKEVQMGKDHLRKEYEQLLSDMLLMKYRVEVFRRNMQIENGCHCDQLSLMTSRSVDELLDLRIDAMREVEKKKQWWMR